MRLGVSNLAWTAADEDAALATLARFNVSGLEVAPTRIAPWADLNDETLGAFRTRMADHGLTISSMQAITFGLNDLALFGDDASVDRLIAHMAVVARIGAALGAGVAVFGAPKIRDRGELDEASADELALERFHRIADAMAGSGVALGLEPVPPAYGNNFKTDPAAVQAFVKRVARPEIVLHLDTGCAKLGDADIAQAVREAAGDIRHFHIAEPHLAGFEEPKSDHAAAAAALQEVGYDRWTVIEMLPGDAPLQRLETALTKVREIYPST